MINTKLTPRRITLPRVVLAQPLRASFVKFKIKTLLPEQKVVEILKNGQVIRRLIARRKTKKFTDRWAKTF